MDGELHHLLMIFGTEELTRVLDRYQAAYRHWKGDEVIEHHAGIEKDVMAVL